MSLLLCNVYGGLVADDVASENGYNRVYLAPPTASKKKTGTKSNSEDENAPPQSTVRKVRAAPQCVNLAETKRC